MDFFKIKETNLKSGGIEIYPDFTVKRSKDLMIRGQRFYAIWDEKVGLWSKNEYDVQRLVDEELGTYLEDRRKTTECFLRVRWMSDFSSKSWSEFKKYCQCLADNSVNLDEKLVYQNTEVKKNDYASKKLPYSFGEGDCKAFRELMGILYEPDELHKLLWAIGSVVSGDSRDIQKFVVLYGEAGSGKSTVLNIIQSLFEGYYTTFEARALASSSNTFSTEVFRGNPLVAIQHDGDLSKIEDNTKLNSIISHEEMVMNEKYKASYTSRLNCFLFMATNRPVKITDSKSGIIRRLIDVSPSGRKIPPKHYQALMTQIQFELGAIAYFCLQTYREMGKNYYNGYRPLSMIFKTDVFFNFVEENYIFFKQEEGVTLKQAYDMYKAYCSDSNVEYVLPKYKFREELMNYFEDFQDRTRVEGKQVRAWYSGFLKDKFESVEEVEEHQSSLVLDCEESIFDLEYGDCPAQYANDAEVPQNKWDNVTSKLKDLDTKLLHYVKVPINHIVIDFDLKDGNGNKSLELNLEAASQWPATYAEFSKGGAGLHLHYIFDGDPETLSNVYSDNIEIKVFRGGSSLRRRLSKCNNVPIAHISSGLPLKGIKMVNFDRIKSENALRALIKRNLKKEIHPGTKPSIDFIYKILDDAYASGLVYDVTDMRQHILVFANNSTHHAEYCVSLVGKMKFKSEENGRPVEDYDDQRLVFFDVEVFPNLLLVNWKYEYSETCVRMINPSPTEITELMKMRLVGFNCRRYDNHILYARYLGWDNESIFKLSQRIVNGERNCFFGEAYNLSYTDVYDFSSKKQSLKKFEIDLGIHHLELGLPWDKPVPEELWSKVAEYCDNDVIATEAVFRARQADFTARKILSELSGLSMNDTTQQHAAKIIFGNDPHPQSKFIYTDLSEMFPGYIFDHGTSTYRDEVPGEGGYVYAEPGMYGNVALIDVESMHPTSIENLNLFGPYTQNFSDVKAARIAIKHKDIESLKTMLGGILIPYLEDESKLDDLAYALKIVINIVYGLTSAKFDNKFRDPRNKDNIVAKRGALFMIDLKHAVQERGYKVAHIKTDSIKIPDATPEIIQFVMEFGKKYGYNFEHEATYERMTLVNDAVYIARYSEPEKCQDLYGYIPKDNKKHPHQWTATGAQFQHPYVFKSLFSKEPLEFRDLCETKTVTSALYLQSEDGGLRFIGKAGSFCPIKPDCGGGTLVREKDGKYYAATGTKGYFWLEAEQVKLLEKENDIDKRYFEGLVSAAIADISEFGDFYWFTSDDPYVSPWEDADLPWTYN